MKTNQSVSAPVPAWRAALWQSVIKLDPRLLLRSPVMLVVELAAVLTTLLCFWPQEGVSLGFSIQISLWLWFTLLFANFAEALAEGRGKARADSLKAGTQGLIARKQTTEGGFEPVAAGSLRKGDVVRVEAGELIPSDGEVIEGIAAVNEAAITGESAPVIRESGGDRSAVTGNTRVVSDWLLVRITSNPGESTLDRMIALVEGAQRQKTPNEIALDTLLIGLTLIFLLVVLTLQPFARFAGGELPLIYLTALLVTLIPTTIGGLLSAIGIAGMDRLMRLNVIAKSGRAVEAAGDVHVLLLDKTGTITFGNRRCAAVHKAPNVSLQALSEAALLSSLADDTPEGRSIVEFLQQQNTSKLPQRHEVEAIAFSAETRLSGADWQGHRYRKGAVDAVLRFLSLTPEQMPAPLAREVERIASLAPSPHMATSLPSACSARMRCSFFSGVASASTSSTPASAAMAAAVSGLSPVTITVRIPICLSRAKRSRIPGFTTSLS